MPETRAAHLIGLTERLRVPARASVSLRRDFDPADTAGWIKKREGVQQLAIGVELLAEYQQRLAAQRASGVLVVLQGIDAAGKDGTIRHVMSGVNPQGVAVHSFRQPSSEELSHDFLWRYARCVPARGQLGIFNRSHYEEVLVVRVHPELLAVEGGSAAHPDSDLWQRRYRDINEWERHLVDSGIHVVKLFLDLSREEQRRRFLKRIDRPEKNWKFSASDVAERARWDDYEHAFSQMLTHTNTDWAPWHVIPADRKWFARIAAAAVLVSALMRIDPQYPRITEEARAALDAARAQLQDEAPGRSSDRPARADGVQ